MEARYAVYKTKMELQIQNERWDEWVNSKGTILADLRQERAMTNAMKTLRDDQCQFVHTLDDRKEMDEASKGCTVEVKKFEKEKKVILSAL
jgi:hypothetical protein